MAKLKVLDDEALQRPFNANMFTRLIRYILPYKKQWFTGFFLMIVVSLCSLANPFLMSRAIGDCLETRDMRNFVLYVSLMVVLSFIGAFSTKYRIKLMDYAGFHAIADLRQKLFDHIQGLSHTFFDTRSAGKIMVRVINDVNSLQDLITNGVLAILIDLITLIILLVVMLIIDWQLTLIAMSIIPLLLILVFGLKKYMRRAWQIVRIKISSMNGYLHESLSGMRVTEAFVREDENSDTFVDVNSEIRSGWMRAIKLNALFWPFLDIISAIGTVLVYIFGIRMMNREVNPLQLANLLVILWYLGRFWDPLNNMSNFYNSVLTAMASLERIFEIMDTPQDIRDHGAEPELGPIKGDLSFEHVTFSYDEDKVILHDVSFDVTAGQTIALVGPTGAGKSTVVNLISRFYDVSDGRILIDGQDITKVQLHSLRKQMSVMLQDSFIFSGTVMDNIRYGRLNATDEEIMEAAKAVHAHDFIMNMENGYMTEVSERGASLSTGQKQLISFARALLNDPRILILDEATSSIDTHTELLIQRALDVLLKGRTSFVIAHRLSTIRKADCIMVVQDGKITESGTHEELVQLEGGHYRALCQAQYRFLKVG